LMSGFFMALSAMLQSRCEKHLENTDLLYSISQWSPKWGVCKTICWDAGRKYENFNSTSI